MNIAPNSPVYSASAVNNAANAVQQQPRAEQLQAPARPEAAARPAQDTYEANVPAPDQAAAPVARAAPAPDTVANNPNTAAANNAANTEPANARREEPANTSIDLVG